MRESATNSPQILGLYAEVNSLVRDFMILVPAVMTRCNDHLCLCVHDLLGLDSAVVDPFSLVGHGPGAATGPAAEIIHPVGVHLHKIFTALLCNPPWLLKEGLTKGLHTLPAVIAWVVHRCQFFVYRFVYLNPSCLYVLL